MRSDSSRRTFLACAAATLAGLAARSAHAGILFDRDDGPPTGHREDFIAWMQAHRGEQPIFLSERWNRFVAMRGAQVFSNARNARAFLMTPREEFVLARDRIRAYEPTYLDIGYGATITGPQIVARMTDALDVQPGDKVLEIGTGSGYQGAYLANLTEHVWTIEIVRELHERSRGIYDALTGRGYGELGSIAGRHADGYVGWKETAPFDRIIVTCGIDHIPPPLLAQLKPGGIMVIPLGPPDGQHVRKIVKSRTARDTIKTTQSDIFAGRTVRFVPFRRLVTPAA
jgi:protein-L-isoaspartate(D-aspartate) O-methyltransferase